MPEVLERFCGIGLLFSRCRYLLLLNTQLEMTLDLMNVITNNLDIRLHISGRIQVDNKAYKDILVLQVQKILNQIISNLAQNQQMQEYCLVVTPEFSADASAQEFICKLVLQEGYADEVFD